MMTFWRKVRKLEKFRDLLLDVKEQGKNIITDIDVKVDTMKAEQDRISDAISFADAILEVYEKRS